MLVLCAFALPAVCFAEEPADATTLIQIRDQIRQFEQARARDLEDRRRDREEIKHLTQRIEQLEDENKQLKASHTEVAKEAAHTTEAVKNLQDNGPPAGQLAQGFKQYLGSHTFQVTGAAGGDFVFAEQPGGIDDVHHHGSRNTFFFNWEPMILYRPADWILFEGELEASFGQTGTGTDLPLADFQLFLNDYVTVVGGLFDQPFGDWFENQSPMWVNRFVTAPLPFGVESVIPPSEVGVQFRGGLQWGELGQDFDYTTWIGNGPSFSEDVHGAALGGPIAIASSRTNGKSFGGRLRFYPLPVDARMGRLELGASTYDSKWLNNNWFNSWGVDFNYFNGNLQTRGEWLQSYRQMPDGVADNRQGWYLQLGYFLKDFKAESLPEEVNNVVQRLEALVRYSGVNQHFLASDDITAATGVGVGGTQVGLIPDFGLSGSPALFAPHSREVAIGLDYWIAPSIVWQNEFDIELPRAGGIFVAGDGTTTPAGFVHNDRAFLSQFTVGF